MKTLIPIKSICVVVLFFSLQPFTLFAQDSELLRTWYLTKIIIEDEEFIPNDYGFYPTIIFSVENNDYYFYLPEPGSESCRTPAINFQTNPNTFNLDQEEWLCLTMNICSDDPQTDPCYIIFGNHADLYFGITNPFTYSIQQNNDDYLTLIISNFEGNQAYYSSIVLLTPSFNQNSFTLYPNPVNETLFINHSYNEPLTATVYNLLGNKVLTTSIDNQSTSIEVSGLTSGLYFITFENETGQQVSKKFVKQ